MISFVLSNDSFDDIYVDMLNQFPAIELKSFECFNKLYKTSLYNVFRCFDHNIEIGYIICFIDDYILVDYLAVYKDYQSNAYGRKVLDKLFEIYKDKKAVLFEVEKVDLDDITTIRRQNFYTKMGCVNSGINYLFPSYDNFLPMDLLYYPLSKNILDKKDILNFIKKFFDIIHFEVKEKDIIYSKIY